MKQILFAILVAFMFNVATIAEEYHVPLTVSYDDPLEGQTDVRRSPVLIPSVYIDGHTLILYSGCDGCTIELRDEDGQTVYSVYVEPGTESIGLPEELAGSFEIRIVRGSLTFVGEIEL